MRHAIALMISASVALALMSTQVKILSASLGTSEIVFLRSLVHLALVAPVLAHRRISLVKEYNPLLVLRGALGSIGVFCLFLSLKSLPVSVAILIAWTSPLFTTLFSIVLGGERPRPIFFAAIAFCFFGLLVFSGTGGAHVSSIIPPRALLIALAGAVSAGASYSLLKKAGGASSPHAVAFYFSAVALLASAPQALATWVLPHAHLFAPILIVGACAAYYQYAVASAYRLAAATALAPYSLLTPLFGAALDAAFFGNTLAGHELAGASLILGGLMLTHLKNGPRPARSLAATGSCLAAIEP